MYTRKISQALPVEDVVLENPHSLHGVVGVLAPCRETSPEAQGPLLPPIHEGLLVVDEAGVDGAPLLLQRFQDVGQSTLRWCVHHAFGDPHEFLSVL